VNIGCDTKFLYLEFLAMKFPRLLAQIYHFIYLLRKVPNVLKETKIMVKKNYLKNYNGQN